MEIPSFDGISMISVHPAFLYESLWNLSIFIFLMFYRNRSKREGEVFFLYLILYGFGRFWIEGLRSDSLLLGNFKVSQVLSAIIVITFSFILFKTKNNQKSAPSATDEAVFNGKR